MSATICLLSPAPVWVNPRIRKEADALFEAGYDVVVGYRADGEISRDDALLSQKPWRWHRIDVARQRARGQWLRAAIRQRGAEWAVRAGFGGPRRAAYCRADDALCDWAVSQRAALYIAHTQPVLAVAAAAAKRTGAAFAFDCEDLLAEEAADGGLAPWRQRMIASLEREHLPRAAYVSAVFGPDGVVSPRDIRVGRRGGLAQLLPGGRDGRLDHTVFSPGQLHRGTHVAIGHDRAAAWPRGRLCRHASTSGHGATAPIRCAACGPR